MPRYLSELGSGDLRETVSARVLDRDGPLWDEPRVVLEQELRDSRNYFAIASALAYGPQGYGEVVTKAALSTSTVSKYLNTLSGLRIVSRALPINARDSARNGRWTLDDPFFRFWFRFVFPYQDELENGLTATNLFDGEVAGPTSPLMWRRSSRTGAGNGYARPTARRQPRSAPGGATPSTNCAAPGSAVAKKSTSSA